MPILKKTLFPENLEKFNVLVNDVDPTSRYFKITELPDVFTGGKNGFLIQGSPELVSDTIIKIEIKDALGNIIYHEPGEGIPEYYEGTSKVVAVYIYPDTAFGPCTITILGELKEYVDANGLITPIPINWEGQYNVKWQTQINVNPALANTSKIRFYRRPKIDITESVLPVYNRTVFSRTISGSISATPINPISGSDYRLFKGVLQYELSATSSIFSQSMEGETITITGLDGSYTPTITDVTTDKKAFVNIPYYVTSSLAPNYYAIAGFNNKPFTLTFDESENLSNSNVSSSFAVIRLTDLESFTGDPARIKVYASSKQDLGDYQLLEDIQIESTEVFLAREFENQLNVRTGVFTTSIINNFWRTENLTTTVTATLDNSALLKSVKLLPVTDVSSSVGLFKFYNSGSIDFVKNTEYALDFTPLLVSASFFGRIEVYGSGSAFINTNSTNDYGKLIGYIEAPSTFRKYDKQQFNFKSDNDGTGNISFVVKGGVWQLANISLRAAHESAFAPNEVTLIADVPTKINNETFDFKFEIYDLNNNYVPVLLEKTFTFTGGNDIRIKRDLVVTPTFNQFNFSTSSAFPSSILIDYTTTGLTGSITFYSQAIDTTGLGITPADLTMGSNYPGLLDYVDIDTRLLTIDSFTGSLSGGKKVGAIIYTASVENINRYFTIYRAEQGAPSYLFYATADKNNFTFDPDDNYKSVIANDYIDIRLVKQNLPALTGLELTIGSGSEGNPTRPTAPLHFTGSIGNASIYRLFVSSSSDITPDNKAGIAYADGQSVYNFTLYTTDGEFTSSVVIDAISKGDKGKGLFASADRNQFFYKMTDLTPTPSSQTSTILVKRQNLGSQTTAITVTKTGSGPDLTLSNNNAGNGVAVFTVNTTTYTYASGETKYTFSAVDLNGTTYTDEITLAALISEAQISINLSNENASLPARSNGFVESGSFVLSSGSVSVKVAGEDITREEGLSTNNRFDIISATEINVVATDTTPDSQFYSISRLDADSGSLELLIRYKDGRGSTSDITKNVTYSKNKKAAPVLTITSTPKAQSVSAKSTGEQIDSFANVTISVTQTYDGSTSNLTLTALTATSADIASISTNPATGLVTLSGKTLTDATNGTTVNISADVTDSEGVSRTVSDTLSLAKVKKAVPNVELSVSPQSQTVTANTDGSSPSAPTSLTVRALEGGTTRLTSVSAVGTSVTVGTITYNGGSAPFNFATIPLSSVAADNASVAITANYTDSEGTAGSKTISATISKSKKGDTGATGANGTNGTNGTNGATGPGVVHTGVWTVGRLYQFENGLTTGTGRRDTVLWSSDGLAPYDTYYATTAAHTATNNSSVSTGRPDLGGPWVSLGTQDFFVAAKIGIFEESFVQNTLNIGTNNNGGVSSANITLTGATANPYISIGQSGTVGSQGYNVNGIFLGLDSSTAKLSLKSGTNALTWDGTTLSVTGTITSTSGTIGGWTIGATQLTSAGVSGGGDGSFTTSGIRLGSTGFISAQNFYISSAGAAAFSGTITATAGTIAGWTISSDSISKTTTAPGISQTITLDSANGRIIQSKTTSGGTGYAIMGGTGFAVEANTTKINGNGITVGGDSGTTFFTVVNTGAVSVSMNGTFSSTYDGGSVGSQAIAAVNGGLYAYNNTAANYGKGIYVSSGDVYVIQDVIANASDKRLKENIKVIPNALDKVSKIRGVFYNWNDLGVQYNAGKDKEEKVGVIAQEIQAVLPHVVRIAPFDDIGKDENGITQSRTGENYLTVQYEKIVPLLIEAIKELKMEVDELKNKLK